MRKLLKIIVMFMPFLLFGQINSRIYVGLSIGHGRSYSSQIYYYNTGSFLGSVQGIYYLKEKLGIGLGYEHGYHDIIYHKLYPELNETQSQSIELSLYKHLKDVNKTGFYVQFSMYPSLNKTKLYLLDSTLLSGGYYMYDYRTENKVYPFRMPIGVNIGYNIELPKRRISFAILARQDIQNIMLYDVFLGVRIGMYWKYKYNKVSV